MSYDIVVEKGPEFKKRIGDWVNQGSNNTIIICGTDRAADGPADISKGLGTSSDSGKGKGTGTIHLIAGRKAEDPDLKDDKSYLYLTMKSKVDDNLNLGSVEKADNDLPGAILKSDLVRLVFRKNIKISSADGKNSIYMDDKKLVIMMDGTPMTLKKDDFEFGKSTSDHMALAKLVEEEFKKVKTAFESHVHPGDPLSTTATLAIAGKGMIMGDTGKTTEKISLKTVKSELVKSK